MTKSGFRAVDIKMKKDRDVASWRYVWGADIWINNIPIVKCLLLANMIVWTLLVATIH